MTTKTAANLIVRTVCRGKGLYSSSSTVQRRCLSRSFIRKEVSEAKATPPKRIPLVHEWDGILITPVKGKKNRSRLDPTQPIRSGSEFQENTLSRDLAEQRIQKYKKSNNSANQRTFAENKAEEHAETEDAVGASVDVPVDMGPLIRRTQKPNRTSMSRNIDAADAALQSFGGTGRPARLHQRGQQSMSKKGTKFANSTHPSGTQGSSTPKPSRRRKRDIGDEAEAALQNVSFSSISSPRSMSSRSQVALMKVFDGDNFAVSTPLKLQSPDPDIVTFTKNKVQGPSESLTVLDPQIDLDADVDAQVKHYEGSYDRHFRPENWEAVDKLKPGKISTPLEYASLTIARNPSLGIKKKKQSVNILERVLQRVPSSTPNKQQPAP